VLAPDFSMRTQEHIIGGSNFIESNEASA